MRTSEGGAIATRRLGFVIHGVLRCFVSQRRPQVAEKENKISPLIKSREKAQKDAKTGRRRLETQAHGTT